MADNLQAVKEGNKMLENMAEKFKRKIQDELDENPVMFCNKPMKVFKCEKYLGENLQDNLSESVYQIDMSICRLGFGLKFEKFTFD